MSPRQHRRYGSRTMSLLLLGSMSLRPPGAAAGLSPIFVRWNFTPVGRWEPFLEIAGGAVVTNREIPDPGTTSRFNFTAQSGGGVRVALDGKWGLMAGYRFHHLSNGNRAPLNPSINSNVIYAGLVYRRWGVQRETSSHS